MEIIEQLRSKEKRQSHDTNIYTGHWKYKYGRNMTMVDFISDRILLQLHENVVIILWLFTTGMEDLLGT